MTKKETEKSRVIPTEKTKVVPMERTKIEPTPPPTRYITDSVEIDYDKYRETSSLNKKKK